MSSIDHKTKMVVNHIADCLKYFGSLKRRMIILDKAREVVKADIAKEIEVCRNSKKEYTNEIAELEQLLK